MAARSYLTKEKWNEAKRLWLNKLQLKGDQMDQWVLPADSVSKWLESELLQCLEQAPGWGSSIPIALGSFARGELTPLSDVDLMFLGEESVVLKVVTYLNERGIKVRYRIPEDHDDWMVGVDVFDQLSLLTARALTDEGESLVRRQRSRLLMLSMADKKELVRQMGENRKERGDRFDSISNYLEPNVKHGPGGYRDLLQSLIIWQLFPEKNFEVVYVDKLKVISRFLLTIRDYLQLLGGNEVLVSSLQLELVDYFGFTSIKEFMLYFQKSVFLCNLVTDYFYEIALSDAVFEKIVDKPEVSDVFESLKFFPSVSQQMYYREKVISGQWCSLDGVVDGNLLSWINPSMDVAFLRSLFRSSLMHLLLPELKNLRGLVQHDQYHRYTVEAHLYVAMKEVLKISQNPHELGRMGEVALLLTDYDWKLLLWAALFHDLGKGQKGEHSVVGAELVVNYLEKFGFDQSFIDEVEWIVENHLLISTAAFRKNPKSPLTWKELHSKGVQGGRLNRLSVFTAIDIRATNIDAWSSWKDRLLFELVAELSSEHVTKLFEVYKNLNADEGLLRWVSVLEPALLYEVNAEILAQDYYSVINGIDLDEVFFYQEKRRKWVRFYREKDESGLLLKFVQVLYFMGCEVEMAFVQTIEGFGVYDWFKIDVDKPIKQLRKRYKSIKVNQLTVPEVFFDKIVVVSESDKEVLISFRGKNQRGALLAAANALSNEGLVIQWARVHTWGQQIDDTFSVKNQNNLLECLRSIKKSLLSSKKE